MTKNVITSSPVASPPATVPATEYFDFFTALDHILYGAPIARDVWENPDSRVKLYDSRLMILDVTDNLWHPWTIHISDLRAEDWYVISA